jgi:arylsulfatase A-like enzyme
VAVAVAVAAERPDVLLIAVDDLNDWTGHLGGHPQARTPNIDRLVGRGVTFRNAHCAAPACNPSRASLMSGLRPWRTGIYTNDDPAGAVLRDTVTLNRHFLAHGYRTVGGGKIYHGSASEGRDDTWTEWVGLFPGAKAKGKAVNLNGLGRDHFDWGPIDVAAADMPDAKLTDWAVEQLRETPVGQPLFLAVGYVKPHLPWHVPREYFDRFPLESVRLPEVREDDLADVPEAGRKMANPGGDHAAVLASGQWKQAVQAYLATVSFLDDEVGRLLEGLENSPRADRTIVVWWTDHGWHLGEKQHWRKFALWEEATRISMAIAAPGVTAPGGRCEAPVDSTAVFPTLCALAGLPVPEGVTGPSLVPWLRDPAAPSDAVAVCTHGRGNHAARDGRWRYIRYADGSEELYDHEADPREWDNLASRPDLGPVKERLARAFPAAADEVPRTGPGGGGKARRK